MKNTSVIKQGYIFAVVLFLAAILLFTALKDLFFFDEDIFIVNKGSEFLTLLWQRAIVCKISYLIDNYLYSSNSVGYHVTNLAIHFFNTILATLVLKEFLKICEIYFTSFQLKIIPLIFFILFLLTPVHSEPLCYILARCGSLVSFFCLLSILFFLKSQLKNRKLLFFSLICFLVALFTYEISWVLPAIIVCVTIFWSFLKKESVKKNLLITLPFFIVFTAWFIIKIIFIDKFVATDYLNGDLFKINFLVLIKNTITLFLRNFIPPFKNPVVFLSVSIIFTLMLIGALVKLFFIQRKIFFFLILLFLLTCSGFSTVTILGIDTHDSESERYIYFSSCFAMMMLAVIISTIMKNKRLLTAFCSTIIILYVISLFKTINYYTEASAFSKKYLSAIKDKNIDRHNIFIINLPSQYHGALLFRAKSRISGNTKKSVSTINEFMTYLYGSNTTKYFTYSEKELSKVPAVLYVNEKPLDSLNIYFPAENININNLSIITHQGEAFNFVKEESAIIALKDSELFIFK